MAYALSVVGAMFRWLIQQRYLLANPFAGIKVRGASRSESLAVTRVFGEGEWSVIQAVAEGLELGYGWQAPAAQRLRFVLDFAYATGLRVGELVGATLGQIDRNAASLSRPLRPLRAIWRTLSPAQPHECLAVLEHLDSPAALWRFLQEQKLVRPPHRPYGCFEIPGCAPWAASRGGRRRASGR